MGAFERVELPLAVEMEAKVAILKAEAKAKRDEIYTKEDFENLPLAERATLLRTLLNELAAEEEENWNENRYLVELLAFDLQAVEGAQDAIERAKNTPF